MIDDKTCKGLEHVFIKFTHANLQKRITWPKTYCKGKHEWKNACEDFGIHLWKNEHFNSKTKYIKKFK